MRTVWIGAALWAAGLVAVATGVLPLSEAGALGERVWPILLFVVAVTVVAELAAEAGVFDRAADALIALAGGRVVVLWLLSGALAAVSTVFLSLDTTAVLLTPVVVTMARRAGANPVPFAVTTVWLANSASLLLPVSNLTNLLAEDRLGGIGPGAFAAMTWPAELAGVLVPMAVVLLVWRRALLGPGNAASGRTRPRAGAGAGDALPLDERRAPQRTSRADEAGADGAGAADAVDRPATSWADPANRLALSTSGVLLVLIVALVTGVPVWIPASAAAIVLVGAFAQARPQALSWRLVPWSMLVFTTGLFLAVTAATALIPHGTVHAVVGDGHGVGGMLRAAGVSAGASNLIDNLPAYLAVEPGAIGAAALVAVLVGTNAGSIVTPWGSLATLLWHQRLERLGAGIRWRRFIPLSAATAVATVTLACLLLAAF